MSSNHWILSSHSPPAAASSELMKEYRARISLEQAAAAERRQRELAEQSSELNMPAVRVRAWETAHGLTLPLDSAHPVLGVVAHATNLTLEQLHEEQRRRSAPAARVRSVEPDNNATETGSTRSEQTPPAHATEAQRLKV